MTFTRHSHARASALVVLGTLLLGTAGARADVRVHDPAAPQPELAIRISPAGPWSLVGPFDATVLNPSGDAYGDGLPDDAPQGELLLAAWVRPSGGRVHLSHWTADTWTPLPPFEARDGIGTPRVDPLGTGWAVTWQQESDLPVIRAGGVGLDGSHHESQPMIEGWLVDHDWLDDVQLVLHWDEEREHLYMTGVLWSVPGVPSPVDIVFQTEVREYDPTGQDGLPSPMLAPAPHPGHGHDTPVRGAWARRVVVSWFDVDGVLHQALVNADGDLRELPKPRFDLDVTMTAPSGGR